VITNVMPHLEAHLGERAKDVFKRGRRMTSPEMFAFGRTTRGAISEEFYRDFADRLNRLCVALNGENAHDGHRPCVDAVLSMPMSVPLADGRTLLTVFVFVYDLPFWVCSYSSMTNKYVWTFDTEVARAWLVERVGHILVSSRDGEIPSNSEDLEKVSK
jgi:hypothetical protein